MSSLRLETLRSKVARRILSLFFLSAIVPVAVLDEGESEQPGEHLARIEVRGIPGEITVRSVVPEKVRVKLSAGAKR